MKFGLDDKTIKDIQQIFQDDWKIDSVVIFGSRAKGNYREDSDIDLAVKGTDVSFHDVLSLHSKLNDLNLSYEIDLIDYSGIKDEDVIEHIDRAGILFYERWKEYKLGDIAIVTMGQSPKGETCNQLGKGIPLLNGPTEFTSKFPVPVQFTTDPKRVCQIGDILFCVRGSTTGRMNFADQTYALGRGVAALRHKSGKQHQRFLKALLDKLLPELLNATSGSVFPNITGIDLIEHRIFIPPLNEQSSIASIFSSLDDKIDLLQQQNKTLEELAETLFRQWFVEDKLEQVPVGSIVDFDPKEKVSKDKEYMFFDMKCLSQNGMSISEGINRKINSGSAFRNNDTLLAKITPCLENGKTGFVMNLKENKLGRGSTEFIVMRGKEGTSPCFVYCLARNLEFRDIAILSMTGTSGRQRVQINVLKEFLIGLSKNKMKIFHTTAFDLFEKIKQNQFQMFTLSQLRDTLLPKLISGEVRIK